MNFPDLGFSFGDCSEEAGAVGAGGSGARCCGDEVHLLLEQVVATLLGEIKLWQV